MSLRTYATPVWPAGTPANPPAAAQAPGANIAAVYTFTPASTKDCLKAERIRYSYSATPTAGSLTIAWTDPIAGAVSETIYIATAGNAWLEQNRIFPAGSTVTMTLAAGGGGVSGTVYVDGESQVG